MLVPLKVLARWYHVPPEWLRAEADSGRLPALRAGDQYLFRADLVYRRLMRQAARPARRRKGVRHAK